MSWKYLAQTSLSDALVKRHEALEEMGGIRQLIVWKPTGQQMSGIHGKKRGGAAGLPLLVFKALLLQGWYGLGDPKLEKQLARDSMSRRSVNLGLSEGVPDHGTVWRFRNMLAKQGLPETLLAEINQPLSAKGLYIKTGEAVIVDATVIEARQSRRPRKGKDGGTPRTQDSEAGHNVKVAANGKKASTYGNKAHANVDGGGFIKAIGHTPGNGHDPQSLKKLLTRTEHRLCADKACAGAEHDKLLAKRPQHRGTGVWRPQATLRHRQGTLPGP